MDKCCKCGKDCELGADAVAYWEDGQETDDVICDVCAGVRRTKSGDIRNFKSVVGPKVKVMRSNGVVTTR